MILDHKVVSIHQPNFFPWLGYFFKIYVSDVFVLLDDVEYTSSGLTKRVLVRKSWDSDESGYLTVPIEKTANHTLIKHVHVKSSLDWINQHLGKIRSVYRRSPFFKAHIHEIESIYTHCSELETLSDINAYIIQSMMKILDIKTDMIKSQEVGVSGKKEMYVINLTKELRGSIYLSGMGARKYQDPGHFKRHGIRLLYNNFFEFTKNHPYPQSQGKEYLPGLSVLDAFFNVGPNGIMEILNQAKNALFVTEANL